MKRNVMEGIHVIPTHSSISGYILELGMASAEKAVIWAERRSSRMVLQFTLNLEMLYLQSWYYCFKDRGMLLV